MVSLSLTVAQIPHGQNSILVFSQLTGGGTGDILLHVSMLQREYVHLAPSISMLLIDQAQNNDNPQARVRILSATQSRASQLGCLQRSRHAMLC